MQVLIMISIQTVDSFQDKNKFQISNFKFSNLLLGLCRTKDKVKRTERGMMRVTV